MAYTLQKREGNTTIFTDKDMETLVLIEGADKAALIDTGMDRDNLAEYVNTLTDKPVMVLITHGHIDHIGRTADFDNVYMDPADTEIYRDHKVMADNGGSDNFRIKPAEEILPLPEMIDLGGVEIQIVPLAGHTPGSVLIVDKTNKNVYTGDAVGSGCGGWMQIDGCLPMSEYKTNIEKAIQDLQEIGVDETWNFYGGHYGQEYMSRVSAYNPLSMEFLKDTAVLVEKLLAGEDCGYEPVNFMSKAGCQPYYTCYGKAELIVVKENIR